MSVPKPKEALYRVSVALTPDIHEEIRLRAEENNLSINRTILQLLRSGINAEREKKQRLDGMLRAYRECQDPEETRRLADELGAMIFGR
ncbi:MAG TPA: hypothetical protein VH640_28395 [Bryobacteraceae bacterium]|jgi:hypothetical protein